MSRWPVMPRWVVDEMIRRPVDIGNPFRHCDFHHAIITKRMAMGLPDSEKEKCNHPCNLLKVEHDIHVSQPLPCPQDAALMLYRIYGRDKVIAWWNGINWRSGKPPFKLPDEVNEA